MLPFFSNLNLDLNVTPIILRDHFSKRPIFNGTERGSLRSISISNKNVFCYDHKQVTRTILKKKKRKEPCLRSRCFAYNYTRRALGLILLKNYIFVPHKIKLSMRFLKKHSIKTKLQQNYYPIYFIIRSNQQQVFYTCFNFLICRISRAWYWRCANCHARETMCNC